jgi:hypothetical protein
MTTYIVRTITQYPTCAELTTSETHTIEASSPDDAMAVLERMGINYIDAEVCDEHYVQLAVYGPDWN